MVEKLKTVTRFHYNVPLMILVCYQIYVTFKQLMDDCACELFCMLFQGKK